MKKVLMILTALLLTVSANAQFEMDKKYAGASLTGLDLSFNGLQKMRVGLSAKAGYMVDDDLMLLGELGYNHPGKDMSDSFSAGAGGRYYIEQNGIFLGASVNYLHASNYNDLMPQVEVGYAFFISRTVTIEPSIYYRQSFKKHADYSTIGLQIGFGIYID
ncbi:hypothetical protein [Hallella colorans]|mgnify:CR=1 FL=1|uniref:hypothetical protein n=1 Tax=Hallella colorans TaxID=1703337 RepID=UPI0023F1487D|nr:hypothetical protein [Hallella colorans]